MTRPNPSGEVKISTSYSVCSKNWYSAPPPKWDLQCEPWSGQIFFFFSWDLWNWRSFGQELCTMYSPNILPSNPLPLAGSIQLAGIMPLSPCGRKRDLECECVGDRPQLPLNMNCSSEDCSTPPENAFSSPMSSSLWWVAPKSGLLNCCCWYS
jgi:hypothetical protein